MESNWIGLIPERLRALARSRVGLADAIAAVKEFEETNMRYLLLKAEVKRHRSDLDNNDEIIRKYAIKYYEATEELKPLPEVTIKMFTSHDYDLGEATEWAKENASFLLVVDRKGFEKMIKGMEKPPPFVTRSITPKATIASKLGHLLIPEDPDALP